MGKTDPKPDFDWDPKKAQTNFQKHRVHFEEAATVFEDPEFITMVDEEHSHDEERYLTIGLSSKGRLLLVAHTEDEKAVRIISAPKATRNEERFYQEAG